MSILGTFLFGFHHYANWRTAVSCAVVLFPIAVVLVIARITAGRKEIRSHGEAEVQDLRQRG